MTVQAAKNARKRSGDVALASADTTPDSSPSKLAVRAARVLLVAKAPVLLAAVGAAGGAKVFIFNVMNLLRGIRVN